MTHYHWALKDVPEKFREKYSDLFGKVPKTDWLDSDEAIKLFIAYAENPLAVGPQLIDAIRRNRDKIRSEP